MSDSKPKYNVGDEVVFHEEDHNDSPLSKDCGKTVTIDSVHINQSKPHPISYGFDNAHMYWECRIKGLAEDVFTTGEEVTVTTHGSPEIRTYLFSTDNHHYCVQKRREYQFNNEVSHRLQYGHKKECVRKKQEPEVRLSIGGQEVSLSKETVDAIRGIIPKG